MLKSVKQREIEVHLADIFGHELRYFYLNKNVVIQLDDLHRQLMADPEFADYQSAFYNTLPNIVELRGRQGYNKLGEVETCLAALYGTLLMRLQSREISKETSDAMTHIARVIALLARYFKLDQEDKLFDNPDSK